MTYDNCRREAVLRLSAAGVTDAGFDALLLLEKAGGPDRTHFELLRQEPVPETVLTAYEELIRRRAERIPLQHLLGEAWFMGLPFSVSPAVLIPRSDTEVLVEAVLERTPGRGEGLRLLDLCTGSGCIGISLAVLGRFAEVTLSDISPEALAVAEENRRRNAPDKRIRLAEGDLLEAKLQSSGTKLSQERFDVICSNPPYIPSGVIPGLMPEVRDHDPILALDGGKDGLDCYRRISYAAESVLAPGGRLFLEIGEEQAAAVTDILKGRYTELTVLKDLAGLDRVVIARKAPQRKNKDGKSPQDRG